MLNGGFIKHFSLLDDSFSLLDESFFLLDLVCLRAKMLLAQSAESAVFPLFVDIQHLMYVCVSVCLPAWFFSGWANHMEGRKRHQQ
jgi:hypothetical protein